MEPLNSLWNFNDPLYRYLKIEDGNFIKSIQQNYLWFAHPETYNDPYDCNLKLPIKRYTKEEWKQYVKFAISKGQGISITDIQIDSLSHEYSTDPNKAQKLIDPIIESYLNISRICCFSRRDDVMLLWSHYSDKHKGICLKFNIIDTFYPQDLFFPIQVEYSEHIPEYDFINDYLNIDPNITNYVKFAHGNGDLGAFQNLRKSRTSFLFGTKSKDWEYEKEVRFIKFDRPEIQEVKIRKEGLMEVIFGYKVDTTIIKKTKALFDSNGYKCIYSKMDLKNNDFGLKKKIIND